MFVHNIKYKFSFCGHKKLMDLVDIDFYTGEKIQREDRSTEHILPKSHGGDNSIKNYAMVSKKTNNLRGNKPLSEWLDIHPEFIKNISNYIKKYWNLKIDGIKYGQEINRTLSKKITYI